MITQLFSKFSSSSRFSALLFTMLIIAACTEDRTDDFTPDKPDTMRNGVEIVPGILIANEFDAIGETHIPPHPNFEKPKEWAEFYNPTDDTLFISNDRDNNPRWFITDKLWEDPTRFPLGEIEMMILPGEYFVVWCDNKNTIFRGGGKIHIHTNFSLSRDGEAIGIFYKQDNGRLIMIDGYEYGQQREGYTEGRYPDGSNNWHFLKSPTPGEPNIKD